MAIGPVKLPSRAGDNFWLCATFSGITKKGIYASAGHRRWRSGLGPRCPIKIAILLVCLSAASLQDVISREKITGGEHCRSSSGEDYSSSC